MAKKPQTERYSIDGFCAQFKIKHLELAGFLGIKPQQINNWKIANKNRQEIDGVDAYIVERNVETKQVNIIKSEKIMNFFKIEVLS